MLMNGLNKLKHMLGHLQPGKIEGEQGEEVLRLLSECWNVLRGSGEGNMDSSKVERGENLEFTPPSTIEFDIERHRGVVHGSVYADIHHWSVDLGAGQAICNRHAGKRTVGIKDRPLKVGPLADQVAQDILNANKGSENLEWKSDTKVKVRIASLIPHTVNRTTAERRWRFRNALEERLQPHGWLPTRAFNVYVKQ